jgi:hypothetical protein
MHETESSTVTFEPPEAEHRPAGSRLSNLSNRLARGLDRVRPEPTIWEPQEEFQYPEPADDETSPERHAARFPIVRHGYDPDLVEEYLAELERDLMRTRASTATEVDHEIARIGEQTSSILRVAHEKAQEMNAEARIEAETRIADAAAEASAIKREAEQRLAQLDSDTDAIWRERERLLEDARSVATALFTLIDEAAERFPAEAERTSDSGVVAAPEPTSKWQAIAAEEAESAGETPKVPKPVSAAKAKRSPKPPDDGPADEQ